MFRAGELLPTGAEQSTEGARWISPSSCAAEVLAGQARRTGASAGRAVATWNTRRLPTRLTPGWTNRLFVARTATGAGTSRCRAMSSGIPGTRRRPTPSSSIRVGGRRSPRCPVRRSGAGGISTRRPVQYPRRPSRTRATPATREVLLHALLEAEHDQTLALLPPPTTSIPPPPAVTRPAVPRASADGGGITEHP